MSSPTSCCVLQPIIAVRTVEGELRVRFGHRRTLAPIQAGLQTVPLARASKEPAALAVELSTLSSDASPVGCATLILHGVMAPTCDRLMLRQELRFPPKARVLATGLV
jgi:hypothetical protein